MKNKLYLDDIRNPIGDWVVVRDYHEFVKTIQEQGLNNFDLISLDHDLADIHYDPSTWTESFEYLEQTGYDCAKWLVRHAIEMDTDLPQVIVHSANIVGSVNIVSYINNYLKSIGKEETCHRFQPRHRW
jgi:hypothetical protein